jgi:cytochrome c oxidase assembly protein subunit 15
LAQILLGTQLREAIDQIANELTREDWIANIGGDFIIHRSFSWVVLILHIGLVWKIFKTQQAKAFPLVLILLILATLITGSGMAYFGVPPFLQPVHLLLATLTFGLQVFMFLQLNRKIKAAIGN